MINQDMELEKRTFTTKSAATEWAKQLKKDYKQMGGNLRFSVKEVLNSTPVRWEATVYTRKTKK